MQLISYYQTRPRVNLNQIKVLLIMKITTCLMFLTCLQVSAKGVAQKVTLNESNSKLEKVLKKIERQTGYTFLYENDVMKNASLVTLHVKQASVDQALNLCFDGQPLTYKIFKRTIVIKEKIIQYALKKEEIKEEVAIISLANIVTGKITNSRGESLAGVSVTVKGATTGTSTAGSGNYSIDVPVDGTLVFSYVGFVTQEVIVQNRNSINIVLQEENTALNEVVVTALGIKRQAKSLTYVTQNVNTEEMTAARELNVINSLQGKVPGLIITTSGSGIGAPSRVKLRGNRSISGDSQPLYIVDGVPVIGSPQDFNSDDFASVNVLKGSNAAAIYGSDAQNGAIIFTTKNGQGRGLKVSFNNTVMLQKAKLDIDYQNEYGQGTNGVYFKGDGSSWGPKMTGQMVDHWTLDPSRAGEQYPFLAQPNNVDDLFQTGLSLSSNLQVGIGGEKTQTFFSTTSTEASGILPNNKLQRNSVLARLTSSLSDNLSLDAKINYSYQENDNPTPQGSNNFNPYQQIYNIPRNIRTQDAKSFEYTNADKLNKQDYWSPVASTAENPYWVLNRNISSERRGRVTGLVSLTYKITNALQLLVRGSYDRIDNTTEQKDYNNTFVRAENGRYTVTKSSNYLFNTDFLLSFKKKFSENWNLDVNGGGNLKKAGNESLSSNTGLGLLVPNFFTISNTNNPVTSYDPGSPSNLQSLYAFGTLSWKNEIFIDITGRNDWSSTLPSSSRSYFYPSVGLSAILSDLIPSFPNVFDFAKVRASYAKVGSSPAPFMLNRTATFSSGGTNGFLSVGDVLPNNNLKPEETKSFETGVDLRFLRGRVGLDATYFKTNTINQLFTVALPVGSGASSFFTNGGNIQNTGVEIMLNTTPVKTENFKWDFDLGFSKIKNTVISISDERPKVIIGSNSFVADYVIQQGLDFGDMFGRGLMRDDQNRVVVGANGVPLITPSNSFNVGTFTPDWKGGITSSFSYKNISFSFVIDHTQGGNVVSYTKATLEYEGATKETLQGRSGGLIFGENIFSGYTAVLADGTPNTISVDAQTLWKTISNPSLPVVELAAVDATNTRLREVVIGYNLPKTILQKLNVSNISVSLVGRNLAFIYRKYPHMDPEILTGTSTALEGFSSFPPPSTSFWGMNLKVNFK